MAVFIEQRPQRVRICAPLMNQTLPGTEICGAGLLINRFGCHETHLKPACRDHNCFGISSIVLLAFEERAPFCGAISLDS